MPNIPGLRSPYAKVGRLVYFGRMLDKIRLHAAGQLPAEYVANLGDTGEPTMFDARCCRFLGIRYADLVSRTLAGTPDSEVLAWAEAHGAKHTDEECEIWNFFMCKRGWRDVAASRLQMRIEQNGLAGKPVHTMFDFLDYDEGRENAAERPWEKV
jgi:gluconokinase